MTTTNLTLLLEVKKFRCCHMCIVQLSDQKDCEMRTPEE